MRSRGFASGSMALGGRRRTVWGSGIQTGNVYGGAGGYGVLGFPAVRPLVGSSRGDIGRGFISGVGVGSGIGVGVGSGFGVGLGSGFGVGLGSGIGASSAVGFGGGLGSGAAFKFGDGFGGGIAGETVQMLGNEKFTMRILNERLASYLMKVHLLEKANAELELKISQFVDSRTSPIARDYSDSLSTISELQTNILHAVRLNGVVFVNLDNATLGAHDFRMKYEHELAQRQTIEADISVLKRLLDELNLKKAELMMHIDTLKEDKLQVQNLHREEMVTTRSKMSGQIHVEVESAPHQDLTSVLEDMRDHYETIASKNRRDLEAWFKGKLETLKQEVAVSAETVDTSKTELTVEKTKVQSLDLELQSVLAVKTSLEGKLSEVQTFYAVQLSGYQLQVTSVEEQLLQLRADLERQSRDYQMLLDIKTRLEIEIAEYRRLLDIGASGSPALQTGPGLAPLDKPGSKSRP
ncbi:keratin, type I cytoskeletal 50 kDa-like [Tachysurus fulvidraco]|uniref:keratin, type I cytoskeletal 50 kDa-like n=1 Tax=Tachysurus fulvidraco TaxID=1234273 RepID=UPI001FED6C9A|nr:keratin, type I cytoskeletal 50 kDa-like [Tachysurus fulvidraco]